MKVLTECSAELISHTVYPTIVIERAGRTCYKSEKPCPDCGGYADKSCMTCVGRSNEFVRMLIERGHEAMIEHATATFKFICDRGVTHELVRHRLASFGQESTRYCNYNKKKFGAEITILQPDGLTDQQWERRKKVLEYIEHLYLEEIGEGLNPQIACGVLPICLKTEIITTANFREWRHILKLRTSKAAHPQIRQMMGQVYDVFNTTWPVFVEDIEPFKD